MKRIDYFRYVRDIPFKLHTDFEEVDYSCYGKHKILKKLLESTGLKVRPRVCENLWSDFTLLPNEIMEIPHEDEINHVYLEVKIKNKWYPIDASLDKALEPVIPVTEWDGKKGTSICVNPTALYHPEDTLYIFEEKEDFRLFKKFMKKNEGFYRAINQWFENIRKKDYPKQKV